MRLLDSNVVSYAFYNNDFTVKCQNAIKDGGAIDTFSLAESFLIIEKETGSREFAQKSIKSLFRLNIQIIDIDLNVIFEALKNINHYKLSIFDMIHYCCAAMNDCDAIISYDKDFDNLEIPREEP